MFLNNVALLFVPEEPPLSSAMTCVGGCCSVRVASKNRPGRTGRIVPVSIY